jgi:hypothetical protein
MVLKNGENSFKVLGKLVLFSALPILRPRSMSDVEMV